MVGKPSAYTCRMGASIAAASLDIDEPSDVAASSAMRTTTSTACTELPTNIATRA